MTKAAHELHYSQPSVSHHLGRLEAVTGARLIHRVARRIRLTPEGDLLALRAREILGRVDAASVEGLRMLRDGHVDIALVVRHADTPDEEQGFRLTHLLDNPLYLISNEPDQRLEDHRDSAWVGGCERCRAAMITVCERAGFTPRIAYSTDDTVAIHHWWQQGSASRRCPGLPSRPTARRRSRPPRSPAAPDRSSR